MDILVKWPLWIPSSHSVAWNVDVISGILAALLDHEDEWSGHSKDDGAVGDGEVNGRGLVMIPLP